MAEALDRSMSSTAARNGDPCGTRSVTKVSIMSAAASALLTAPRA
jgi:hypothetical protein